METLSVVFISWIQKIDNIYEFCTLAIPSITVVLLGWIGYHCITIMGGLISITDQVYVIVAMQILFQSYTIGAGLQIAIASLIGNTVGSGNVPLAKKRFKHALFFALLINIVQGLILWFFQWHIFNLFTKSEKVQSLREEVYPFVFALMMLDFWNITFQGSIKGLGKQAIFNLISFIAYYVFCVPVAYYLAFKQGQGCKGLYTGFVIGIGFQVLCQFLLLTVYIDWNKEAEKAQTRLSNDDCIKVDNRETRVDNRRTRDTSLLVDMNQQ